jgi:hypothetical protein
MIPTLTVLRLERVITGSLSHPGRETGILIPSGFNSHALPSVE